MQEEINMTNREKYILSIYEELSDMGKHENVKLVKNTVNIGVQGVQTR